VIGRHRNSVIHISLNGSVVAGIGVSGAPTGEIDASCAADGINAIS
jgi:uncharacterized protein GlcG (DUF336 family)